MRDAGETEVGGYGITPTEDPLLITDFCLIKQKCTEVEVKQDEEDSARFVEKMFDSGIAPWQCQNIWIHTHPGNGPDPSGQDETNFNKSFSHPHWAIFFIVARGGATYCRVRHNVGPGIEVEIDHEIDYSAEFRGTDHKAWEEEYKNNVTDDSWVNGFSRSTNKLRTRPWWACDEKTDLDIITQDNIDDLGSNICEVTIDEDGVVEFWDHNTQNYYEYSKETGFVDQDASFCSGKQVFYTPSPEPPWMDRIRRWTEKQLMAQETLS